MKHTCSPRKPFTFAALLFASLYSPAQRPQARLAGGIAGAARVVLTNSRTPHANRGRDQGAVSPEMAVPGITLVFKRSATQQKELEELLAAQQDTASPLFHRWLTPDAFAARFGVADADIAATESWLRSQGFQIDGAARGRDRITFSGSAAQVRAAFGAELHHYQVDGETHFAPASDLMLPAELAPLTGAVLHLSDFRPKPSVVALDTVRPQFTSASSQAHYLTPNDVLTMYGIPSSARQTLQGSGQSLAVVGQSYVNTGLSSAVAQFQTYASQINLPTAILVPGSGVEAISPGDQGESELDLEYASGIAPNSRVFLIYVGVNRNYNVFDALELAIMENIAPVISISYGACEPLLSATELNQYNALFQQAAAQGQTLVAAAGDSGSTSCANYPTSSGVTAAQQQSLAVTFPASSPYVTAVGGTQMAAGTFNAGANNYWAGASTVDVSGTLLGYVPEVVWNEGSAMRGIIAGGGGTSTYYPRPAWQTGVPGIAAGAYRLLPDIAMQSSIQAPGFLICTSDRSLTGSQSSCVDGLLGSGNQYTIAGGTSFATPIFAGLVALLNQAQQTTGQGNINPTLYALASNPSTYAGVFHDITSGTIACPPGAPSCAAPGQSGYAATPGYDEATGLGSFDFGKLLAAWPSSGTSKLVPTNTSVFFDQYTTAIGTSVPVQITVGSLYSAGGSSPPTGTVSVSLDGVVAQPSLAFTSADTSSAFSRVSFPFTAPAVAGSHVVTVSYSGDALHAPSTGTGAILVGDVIPSGSFSLAAGNVSIVSGSIGTDAVTITPISGYSGRLTWSLSLLSSGGGGSVTGCYGISSPAVNGTSTATLRIGVGSACTSAASSGSVRTLVSRTTPLSRESDWPSATRMGVYAGLLACGLLGWRRKELGLPNLFAVALFTLVVLGLTGCGSSSSSTTVGGTTTNPPVSAATIYTLSLKGTDSINSSITASTTFTLTVN